LVAAMAGMVAMVVREEKAALVASVVKVAMVVMAALEMAQEMVQIRISTYQWCRPGCTCRLGGDG
jgi:hypothetical protein